MSDNAKVKILIEAMAELRGIREANNETKALTGRVVELNKEMQETRKSSTGLMGALKMGAGIAIVQVGMRAVAGLTAAFRNGAAAGMEFNAMLEQQSVAFRTLLGSQEAAVRRMEDW